MKVEVEDLKIITLKPGDTLVVRFSDLLPSSWLRSFKAGFIELFPDNKLLIISNKIELYKVIRDEKEDG